MFVRDILLSCLRRWYFLVAGLGITVIAAMMMFAAVPPSYTAKASMTLIPPKVAVTVGDNPYLYMGGLDQALGVLQVKVMSPEVSGTLLKKFHGSALEIGRDATTAGPIMVVAVTADTPEAALELAHESTELVSTTLGSLQSDLNVPKASLITVMELSKDTTPITVAKKRLQMTAIVAVGGSATTLLFVALIDRLMFNRKSRKSTAHRSSTLDATYRNSRTSLDDIEALADPQKPVIRRSNHAHTANPTSVSSEVRLPKQVAAQGTSEEQSSVRLDR